MSLWSMIRGLELEILQIAVQETTRSKRNSQDSTTTKAEQRGSASMQFEQPLRSGGGCGVRMMSLTYHISIIMRQCGQIRKLHLLTPVRLAAPPHISRQKKTHAKASYSFLDEAYNETSYWIACQ